MDVVKRIESYGSRTGATSKEIVVANSGQISAEPEEAKPRTAEECNDLLLELREKESRLTSAKQIAEIAAHKLALKQEIRGLGSK